MQLSARVSRMSPSPTLAISEKAKEMQGRGIDVIGFGAGQPDFPAPEHVHRAAVKAIEEGCDAYTPVAGIPELKEAIADKFRRDNNLSYGPDQIIVGCGAKHVLYNIFQALVGPGDEVLLPAPYWVSYPEQVKLAGAEVVEVPAGIDTGYRVTPEMLRPHLSERTRVLLINSPGNPSGAMYSEDEMRELARFCLENEISIVSDEIYEKMVYGSEHVSPAALDPEVREITVTVNGVSKAYAMTGWRIGYAAAADGDLIRGMSNLQSHSTSNPTAVSQMASLAALKGSEEGLKNMVGEFRRRRDFIVEALNSLPGVECETPGGAFYVFPDFSSYLGRELAGRRVENSVVLAEIMLEEAGVAAVPGSAFGLEGCLRFSYATGMDKIEKGMERLEALLGG